MPVREPTLMANTGMSNRSDYQGKRDVSSTALRDMRRLGTVSLRAASRGWRPNAMCSSTAWVSVAFAED